MSAADFAELMWTFLDLGLDLNDDAVTPIRHLVVSPLLSMCSVMNIPSGTASARWRLDKPQLRRLCQPYSAKAVDAE
jgi:hypothetical protein